MKKNEWNENEIKILNELYPHGGVYACKEKLQRTPFAIRKKARQLKIKKELCSINKNLYSKELLFEIVQKSKSFAEVIRNLNMVSAGSNYTTIRKYIEKYNLDISHFETKKNLLIRLNKAKPLSEILVKDSTYCRTTLKKRLYNSNIKKEECELCGQLPYWNGKKMSLILDHINGIFNDNRIENLRIVCPNCNATLETHCGKNNKKIHKCIDCGKRNSKKCERCIQCSNNKNKQENYVKFSIEKPNILQLKKDIQELGYCGTGRKYGVSDNTIRNWIKKYNN